MKTDSRKSSLVTVLLAMAWDAAQDSRRYRVYRATGRFGEYQALNPQTLLSENRFFDPEPVNDAWYMVRAQALQQVNAGSFYQFSQGSFVSLTP